MPVVIVWMQPEFLHKQSLHHSMVCVPTFNASEQKCSNRWTKSAVGSCRLFRASTTQWNCKSSKCPTSWRSSTKSSNSSFSFSESMTSFLVNTTIAFSSSLSSAWYENDTMQNFISHHASLEQFRLYTKLADHAEPCSATVPRQHWAAEKQTWTLSPSFSPLPTHVTWRASSYQAQTSWAAELPVPVPCTHFFYALSMIMAGYVGVPCSY